MGFTLLFFILIQNFHLFSFHSIKHTLSVFWCPRQRADPPKRLKPPTNMVFLKQQ